MSELEGLPLYVGAFVPHPDTGHTVVVVNYDPTTNIATWVDTHTLEEQSGEAWLIESEEQ